MFERGLGVVGYIFQNILILIEKFAPQNGYFFRPFCDIYQYSYVQCRL